MLFLSLAFGLMPWSAQARGFINNGKEWLASGFDHRSAYVKGINDGANFVFVDDKLDTAIVKIARTQCLVDKSITSAVIADMITNAYQKEANIYANIAPYVVYIAKLGHVCRDHIIAKRAEFGLPPQ